MSLWNIFKSSSDLMDKRLTQLQKEALIDQALKQCAQDDQLLYYTEIRKLNRRLTEQSYKTPIHKVVSRAEDVLSIQDDIQSSFDLNHPCKNIHNVIKKINKY